MNAGFLDSHIGAEKRCLLVVPFYWDHQQRSPPRRKEAITQRLELSWSGVFMKRPV